MDAWRRSCLSGSCVEVSAVAGRILVRDSKDPSVEPLSLQPSEWDNAVIAPLLLCRIPTMVHTVADGWEWRGHTIDGTDHHLVFTAAEWTEFARAVRAGKFTLAAIGVKRYKYWPDAAWCDDPNLPEVHDGHFYGAPPQIPVNLCPGREEAPAAEIFSPGSGGYLPPSVDVPDRGDQADARAANQIIAGSAGSCGP